MKVTKQTVYPPLLQYRPCDVRDNMENVIEQQKKSFTSGNVKNI